MGSSTVRIIKARVIAEGVVVVRRHELESLDAARRAVDAAEHRARKILEGARSEAAKERARGHREGLAEGEREAAQQSVALRAAGARMRTEAGDRLIQLAVELARRVLQQELRTSEDAVVALARRTLKEVSWCREITLTVHPDDARTLRSACPLLAEALDAGAELRIEEDDSLAPGACHVETESGEVDGSVEVQLAQLEKTLLADREPGADDA